MVKANAYGHGINEIIDYAYEQGGITNFGVASIEELSEVNINRDINFWIFSELGIRESKQKYQDNIIPVLSTLSDLNYFIMHYKGHKFALKFNTGMNRLGIEDVDQAIKILKDNQIDRVEHLMTHFSSSYFKIQEGCQTSIEYSRFVKIKEIFDANSIEYNGTSVSNSGAIEQGFGLKESHIRPGLMLYGPASFGLIGKSSSMWKGKIISSLESKIIDIRKVLKGTKIGYGGTKVKENGYIVYIPIGYGDGLLNYYSGAQVRCADQVGYIFGRVNMDITSVFFKYEPKSDFVKIWDENLVNFCTQVSSIPYQVLTNISRRVPKLYH
jgi:alanine racemase